MISVTEYDLWHIQWWTAVEAARALGVEDPEFSTMEELLAAVRERDPDLGSSLEEFHEAYRFWWRMKEGAKPAGVERATEHFQDMLAAMQRRNATRNRFQAALKLRQNR